MTEKNDLSQDSSAHFLTSLNYSSDFSQTEYLDYCKKINKKFIPKDFEKLIKLDISTESKNLNIGFISPDLKEHSVTDFLIETLKELKKRGFKIYAFNLRKIEELDHVSHSLMEIFDGWHNLADLSDLESANKIRQAKINILIDFSWIFCKK